MIKKLKLINFRNFSKLEIFSLNMQNFIIWENWKWKTNILEALSLITNNSLLWINLNQLIKLWENFFFIEYEKENNDKLSFSYSKKEKKKTFILNNNKITNKKFIEITNKSVIFSPISMNIFYLQPSLRRDFLDNLLKNSFSKYNQLLILYKKIIKNRNTVLKNIYKWKCNKKEILIWDNSFVDIASKIYKYRFKITDFLQESMSSTSEYFNKKIVNVKLKYISKVSSKNIKNDLIKYITINKNRDIIMQKTTIWPHIDDFDIFVDWIKLINFASRWETKSIIIWLKLLEGLFIEKMTGKKPILLIDDLLSELDEKHKNMILNKIKYYQIFISSINIDNKKNIIKL